MKAQITLPNIKGFLQGNYRKVLEDLDFLPVHIKEQWLYRIGQMNEDCLVNKHCPCKCSVPEKQLEDRPCEKNCYPRMMNEETWETFKQKVNISSTLDEAEKRIKKYKI